MTWPEYTRLRRYRPGRSFGPLHVDVSPDHLPWPQVSAYRNGDYVALSFWIGPLGPDPVLAIDLTIRRPEPVMVHLREFASFVAQVAYDAVTGSRHPDAL